MIAPNLAAAREYLRRLDPEAPQFTFQTFSDTGRDATLARIVHADPANGALDKLADLNARGAGVFVTVNVTDGAGRQAQNVERVRAVFVDLDGAPLGPVLQCGLEPHIVCESSPGRFHAYWLVDDCPLDQFERVQRALARRFNGDPSVHDLSRVLRVPGFLHQKAHPFVSRVLQGVGSSTGPAYTLAEIVGTLALQLDASSEPRRPETTADGKIGEGGRNAYLFAQARSMAKRGLSPDAVLAALSAENEARCDPPLPSERLRYIAERAFAAKDAPGWQDRPPRDDDATDDASPSPDSEAAPEGDPGPPPLDLLRSMVAPGLRAADVPDVLARFAESQARATGFDVSILLAAGIGAACAMLSDDVRLLVSPRSGWFESARLWSAIVGGPGSGKTPGTRAALAPVFAVHRELIAEWAALPKDENGDAPPMPAVYVNDATTEALADVLHANSRGVLYSCDELEAWLGQHDAYRSGAGKDRGEWLRLFDGGPHQVNRVKRGAFFVPNWGVSLLAATTPAALRKLSAKLPDDGLLQRMLLVLVRPRRLPDGAMFQVETRTPAEAWDRTLRRLYAAPGCVVRLSPEAREAFDAEQDALHRLTLAFEDAHPSFASHVAKRAAMLARLALVFHALASDDVAAEVSGATMLQAVAFMRRQERHAQAIYGSMFATHTGIALARDIARTVLAARLAGFNRRDLAHRCRAVRTADEPTRQAALSLLADCGWLTPEAHAIGHGTHWQVDNRVHELYAEHGEAARQRRELVRARFSAATDEDDE